MTTMCFGFVARIAVSSAVLCAIPAAWCAPPSLPSATITRTDGSSLRRLFPGERSVQLRAVVSDPGPTSQVRVVLWAVEAAGFKNRRLIEQQGKVPKPAKGNRSELVFTFTLPRDWPPGEYRMDIQLDKLPVLERSFTARPAE